MSHNEPATINKYKTFIFGLISEISGQRVKFLMISELYKKFKICIKLKLCKLVVGQSKNFYLNQTWIFLKQENQLWMKDYQKKFNLNIFDIFFKRSEKVTSVLFTNSNQKFNLKFLTSNSWVIVYYTFIT